MQPEELIAAALSAMENAYAPYSGFKVGAVLLSRAGQIYTGANVENATYGATCCAERVALFKAVSEGEREFTALAVVSSGDQLVTPCGICRQVLYEFAPDLTVYATGDRGRCVEQMTLKELLPRAFGPKNLMEGNQ